MLGSLLSKYARRGEKAFKQNPKVESGLLMILKLAEWNQ